MDGALRTCHDAVKHTTARSAVDAGFRVEVEVYGVFTRALREADRRRMDAYSVRKKQGLVPDLQLDDSHYELKGIRVGSSRTNYNGGVRSTGFSTGSISHRGVARRQSGCRCSTCGSAGGLRCGGRKRRSSLVG
jgi:hypothetical protein